MHEILRGPDLRAALSIPPKDESGSGHASNSKKFTYDLRGRYNRRINQRATKHQILRDPDLHPSSSMPPKVESASNDVLNSKRSRLTIYIVDATDR